MTLEGIAKKYFKENKETKELFATSDNFLFLLKKDAQNHAQTLEDSTVKRYNSSELLDESDDSEEANQGDPTDILQLSKNRLEKAIDSIEDIGLLEALILQEENEQNRSEVLSLLAGRIEIIKNQA